MVQGESKPDALALNIALSVSFRDFRYLSQAFCVLLHAFCVLLFRGKLQMCATTGEGTKGIGVYLSSKERPLFPFNCGDVFCALSAVQHNT